jgi:hypothetical protein
MYLQLLLIIFITIFYLSHFGIPSDITKYLPEGEKPIKIIPTIKFMSKAETKAFILADKDKFITNLDAVNKIARGVKSNDEYLTITSKSATDFTESEKKKLTRAIRTACDKLVAVRKRKLKGYGIDIIKLRELLEKWTLAKTKDRVLEMGMPHTRRDIIFLSSYYLANNIDNIDKLTKTMIHEIIHIYQRNHSGDYIQFLKAHDWEIHPYNGNDKRLNPDLDELVWKRPAQRGEVSTKATRVEAGGYKIFIAFFNSRNPKDLKDINIKKASEEHPYEYYAYKLSEEITK